MYDSKKDTKEHISAVQTVIKIFTTMMEKRGENHDKSKLEEPEKSYFDKYTPKLKELTYGSDEYKKCLDELNVALQHHYENNRHHPEFHKNGIYDMSLIDIVEMFCDWISATMRHEDGDIIKSIEINKDRFGYDDLLESIFKNTVSELTNSERRFYVPDDKIEEARKIIEKLCFKR